MEMPFYFIESSSVTANELDYKLVLIAEHPIYLGHFPNQPIVPGVVLLHILKEVTELGLDKKLRIVSAKKIAFRKIIEPKQNIDIGLKIEVERGNDINIKAEFDINKSIVAKLDCVFVLV